MRQNLVAFFASLTFLLPPVIGHAATITIINADSAGEGFNDTTPFTSVGGNTATTRGQARLNAFRYAADLVGSRIRSDVEIRVEAQMNPLGGTAVDAILGAAGPYELFSGFSGALFPNTWYVGALANKLANSDLSTLPDIDAEFNSDVDNSTVLGANSWYYGLDGNPPGNDIDFVVVVMHELVHGLGFLSTVNLTTGEKYLGRDDAYMRHLEHHGAATPNYPSMTNSQRVTASTSQTNLHWTGTAVTAAFGGIPLTAGFSGGHVQMYAPSTAQPGSSVSHFDTAVTPNELMEPAYTSGINSIGLAEQLLTDIGWGTTGDLSANLSLTMTDAPDPAAVSANLAYAITVSNAGPDPANGSTVTDVLPAGVTLVSAIPSQGSCSGTNTVSCYLGTIPSGGNATVTLTVQPTAINAALANSASVSSPVSDTVLANNSANTTTNVSANAVPVISTLSPSNVPPGSANFTLTVNGSGFVNGAVVRWNGANRVTTFVSSSRVTAAVLAADVATAGTVSITVFNPAPGGGTSNNASFSISNAPPVGSGGGGGGCFIATAAYGTPMAEDVRYLRAFRDQHLLDNPAGQWFVQQYYKLSPPLADYIREHEGLKSLVRAGLTPLVGLSKLLVNDEAIKKQTADRP